MMKRGKSNYLWSIYGSDHHNNCHCNQIIFAGTAKGKNTGIFMNNMRRYKRIEINVMEVNGTVMFTREVEVIDISIEGMALESTKLLNLDQSYALRLKDRSKSISLNGTVVWSTLSGTKNGAGGDVIPIYKVGLKFNVMPAEKTAEVLLFIETNKKNTGHTEKGKRLHIRFHIDNPASATMNLSGIYKVKEISLGGMLIKSPHDLEIESRIPMDLSLQDEHPIKFVGRVASCLKTDGDDGNRFDIGIEFFDLTDDDRKNLRVFVDYAASVEYQKEP
jgi:Tfp pilus assembly protein PilZ